MDATAACIVHEELSAADPALCLSYLGELEAGGPPPSREVALSTSNTLLIVPQLRKNKMCTLLGTMSCNLPVI